MENLTLAQKIIKPHTIDPLEGHTVVVIEKIGEAGEEFRFEIEPGQRVPRTALDLFRWLRGGRARDRYFAYAVTNNQELRQKYSAPVRMEGQAHSFNLVINLAYAVAEPRLLVTRRNDDPVRQLRDEVAAALRRELARRSWLSIRAEFQELETEIVALTRERLQRFASGYGLQLTQLSASCELDEVDFLDLKDTETIELQKGMVQRRGDLDRVKVAQESKTVALKSDLEHDEALRHLKHADELSTLDRLQQLQGRNLKLAFDANLRADGMHAAMLEAAQKAILTIGTSIHTPNDLLQAFNAMRTISAQSGGLMEGGAATALPGSAMLGLTAGQGGAGPLIAEMLSRTEQFGWERAPKQRLQSAMLHLIAELLLNGDSTKAMLEQYSSRIADIRAQANLPLEQFDYLKKYVEFDRLAEELG